MLGPSDFRKNLSYLLDPFSGAQYALKRLLEFRLPPSITHDELSHFVQFVGTDNYTGLIEPLNAYFSQLSVKLCTQIKDWLFIFFEYAKKRNTLFDFRDCSIGNLIFAGAFLAEGENFNAAAKKVSQLVSSRALLVNVSKGENRILVALKENGELLANEAQIVGPQSSIPIKNIFLMPHPISPADWQTIKNKSIAEKEIWLSQHAQLPAISTEATKALADADIIIYGPGTQHSSLFPSYLIAEHALKQSHAPIKAFVVNLAPDHDTQSLSANNLIDTALIYMGDPHNLVNSISHILLDKHLGYDCDELLQKDHYKNATVITQNFVNDTNKKVHNGSMIVKQAFSLLEKFKSGNVHKTSSLNIFVDINKRSLALDSLLQEFLEMNWKKYFFHTCLTINQTLVAEMNLPDSIEVNQSSRLGSFPEISFFNDWLHNNESEYLVLLTGDGEYRFRDVMLGIHLLEQSNFGAVFGSRNQSRRQFKASLRAAYGEKKLLSFFSFLAAFLMSAIFAIRFGIIFSDPLSGFRIFKRSKISHLAFEHALKHAKTPIAITKILIRNKVEIAELPVNYRTFSGFSDPHWRFKRGIKNLFNIFFN